MSAESHPAGDALHVPSLDGIRGLSFLLVFAAHAGLERVVPGGFGVTVFFFLSGFLITTLMRIESQASGTVLLRAFYLRRALRILPPFYLVLGLSALAATTGVLPGGLDPRALGAQALHLANFWIVRHGYGGQPAGTGVYWSLAVEEHFYLLFPVLYLALIRGIRQPARQALVLWGLCALVLAWRCALVFGMHSPEDRTYVATDARLDSILFGCALALRGNPVLDGPSRFSDVAWKRGWLPAAVAMLFATFMVRAPSFRESLRYTLQGIALGPVFVVAVRFPAWGPMRLLNVRALGTLGVFSYSMYLVHHVVLEALPWSGSQPGVVRAALAFAISVGFAWVVHVAIERPCGSLRRLLTRRWLGPVRVEVRA